METEEDLKIETEQVKYWEECLNSLAKQFEILLNSMDLNLNIHQKKNSIIEKIKINYKTNSKQFKKEPSHLYCLSEIFFDFCSCLRNVYINPDSTKLLSQLNKSIKEIIQNITQTKNEACKSSFKIIKKCKDLITNIKEQENEYQKAKTSLDDAQIYQKKIKNVDKYTYNVAKKEKADLLLAEKIKEMEKIKNPLENNKKKLIEYRTKLKVSLRDNFELIVSTSFKQLANYYQILFLLLNNQIEILNNIKGKIDDILIQLSNLIFDLNDYSEKKFGETNLGIKSECVSMYLSDEYMNKSSMKQLIEISECVINSVKIFLICLRYRKKIMKLFLASITDINKYEKEYNKEYDINKRDLISQLDSLKNINYYSQKNWRNAISKQNMNEIYTDINTIIPIINNYIEFVRNEYNIFLKNWEKYEEKINDRRKLSIDFLNEINEAQINKRQINQKEYNERYGKKKRKLKEVINSAVDFIHKTVPTTREKDKNEMLKMESAFEKLFHNCQNNNNEIITSTEEDLNNTAMTDIFEECQLMIIKYFNRFKIQNYENFLEKMRIKLLVNTNLNEGKLGKGVYRRLSIGNEEEKLSQSNNIILDSQNDILLDNEDFRTQRAQTVFSKNRDNNNQFQNEINENMSNNLKNSIVNKSINNIKRRGSINSINSNLSKKVKNNSRINNNISKSININNNNNNEINNSINSSLNNSINNKNIKKSIKKTLVSKFSKSTNLNINNNNKIINSLNNNINNINNNLNENIKNSIKLDMKIDNNIKNSINDNLNNNIDNDINNNINNINNINNKVNDNINNNINNTINNNINNNLNKSNNNSINENEMLYSNINNEEDNINDNLEEEDDNDYNFSSFDILNELENEDNLALMDDNKLQRYTEMKDPYSNIKEDELNRLLNMKEEDKSNKNELDEDEKKIKSFSCSLSSQIISRGTLMVTNKKIVFDSSLFKKVKIIIPLIDIISIKKKTSIGIDNSIQIKTEKVTYLFTSFLSRDFCYSLLDNEIKRVKKEAKAEKKNNNEEENVDVNSPEQKYLGKKRFKAKQITKMLEEIEFYKKLEEITKERMELFTKEYTDEKKGFFISQKTFKRKYAEELFQDCPLFVVFSTICNMTTKLEEYKKEKGFFESLFLNRGDTEVKFEEIPEFSNNIPNFFNNGDYVMNIFSQFNKEDFENFLNEIQNWPHKYEYTCHAIHKVKQVPFGPSQVVMKDRFIAYFISPTLLIFDDMAYATEFTFCDNFVPLFRYRFDCDIKFNDKKGKFEFNTKMTISYITIFLVNFMLKSTVESKSNSDTEELIKGEVLDKLKESLNIYIERFKDIFERTTDETFQRKIDLKQNMITGEIEEDIIEGVGEEENPPPETNTNEKKEENENNEEINKEKGIHQKINEFIDNYKTYIFIGIIVIFVLGIILSIFGSGKGKGSLAIDTIFNLIILGAIFYLFKFK